MKLRALVGEKEYELNSEEVSELDALKIDHLQYHVLYEDKSYHTRVLSMDLTFKQVVIEVNGSIHIVQIQDDLDRAVQQMGFKLKRDKMDNIVLAPMPGLILEILVEVGQEVEKGQGLMILEAMKMENVIKAESNGIIKNISINKGDAVEKKALLIEFEV